MKHYLIYTNQQKDKNLETTNRIRTFLEKKGQTVSVITDGGMNSEQMIPIKERNGGESVAGGMGEVHCMLVLGGDGTVLRAARTIARADIPILGINLGTLGYLTEVELNGLEDALQRLLTDDYFTEKRLMLEGTVAYADDTKEEEWALNDVVISRSGSLQIIRYNIYVNGQFLNSYNADGMIVTTPTGSTGYNLSAGGPLVDPGADLIMMTPICPHSLNQRSIVLSSKDVIEIEIPEGKDGGNQIVEVSFDGSHMMKMQAGDRIRVCKSSRTITFIRLNKVSFLEVLHKKMGE